MSLIHFLLVPAIPIVLVASLVEGRQTKNLDVRRRTSNHHALQAASVAEDYDDNPLLPRFTDTVANVTVTIGSEAILTCIVDNLRGYKVAWVRVDTQTILSIHHSVITQNPRISLSHNDHHSWYLCIKDVKEVDRGWYMCQVNTDPMRSRQGYLDVVVPPSIIERETSTDIVVRESLNVTLTCKASGYPEPYIMWKREDGEPINYNGEIVNVVDGEVLHFTKVSRLHMGAYLCIASNGVPPSVSKRTELRVQFPPMLSISNQLEGAYVGQNVSLECHTEAYPTSINYWTTDKDEMIGNSHSVADERYHAIQHDNGYNRYMRLTIKNVGPKDFRSYKCIAQNSLGMTDGLIKLDEIPAPSTTTTTIMTMQTIHYPTRFGKYGKNDNKKLQQRPNDYELEEWRDPDYDRDHGLASMRPPGELPSDITSKGVALTPEIAIALFLIPLLTLYAATR